MIYYNSLSEAKKNKLADEAFREIKDKMVKAGYSSQQAYHIALKNRYNQNYACRTYKNIFFNRTTDKILKDLRISQKSEKVIKYEQLRFEF